MHLDEWNYNIRSGGAFEPGKSRISWDKLYHNGIFSEICILKLCAVCPEVVYCVSTLARTSPCFWMLPKMSLELVHINRAEVGPRIVTPVLVRHVGGEVFVFTHKKCVHAGMGSRMCFTNLLAFTPSINVQCVSLSVVPKMGSGIQKTCL